MTIRHLRIFTAVAEAGSMSAAAKALFVSQPSVSHAIGELEKEFGVRLFERLSQKLYLTGEGELMLSYSRHILDSISQLEQAMGQAAKGPTLHIEGIHATRDIRMAIHRNKYISEGIRMLRQVAQEVL